MTDPSPKTPRVIKTPELILWIVGVTCLVLGGIYGIAYYSWHYEDAATKAKKEELIPALLERSLNNCILQTQFTMQSAYEPRMTQLMRSVKLEALEFIYGQNITICFDSRLQAIEKIARDGWLWTQYHYIRNAYYPASKTITILDNEDMSMTRSVVTSDDSNIPYNQIEVLVSQLKDGYMTRGDLYLGVRYNLGKSNKATHRSANKYIAKEGEYRDLYNPPLKR